MCGARLHVYITKLATVVELCEKLVTGGSVARTCARTDRDTAFDFDTFRYTVSNVIFDTFSERIEYRDSLTF